MKKSNTNRSKFFSTIGERVCLPLITQLTKRKIVNVTNESNEIVSSQEIEVSDKEKIIELWISKKDIGIIHSYINNKKEISPVRCYITDNKFNEKYLIACSPLQILNIEKKIKTGYGA